MSKIFCNFAGANRIIEKSHDMKNVFTVLSMLLLSAVLTAAPKPLRIVVLGDDPFMSADASLGSFGYADLLQPVFDSLVTVEAQTSLTLLPNDPVALLEPARKGDMVLLCKRPVPVEADERTLVDIYLEQLVAIQQTAKKKGVQIIWLTPVCPRYFTAEGVQVRRLGNYPDVIRKMCRRDMLELIDLEKASFDWLTAAGQEASAEWFISPKPAVPAAENKVLREGIALTEQGAYAVKELIANAIRDDKKSTLYKRLHIEAEGQPAQAEEPAAAATEPVADEQATVSE